MNLNRRLIIRDLSLIVGASLLVFLGALVVSSGQIGTVSIGRLLSDRLREFTERELRAGELVISDGPIIESIDTIVGRLNEAPSIDLPRFTVLVIRSDIVNAMALPGGLIVVYTGLIETLSSADEFAAILAHEIGHVARGDPTRQLIRSAGLGVINLLFGSGGEVLIERLFREAVALSYAKRYELRADEYAISTMEQAGLNPGALGRALERLKLLMSDNRPLFRYLDPHEDIDTRIARSLSRSLSDDYDTIEIEWEELQF